MALTQISTNGIKDATIATADIADDAVTSAKIADDAITSALIADDAITSALIADDAIVAAAIADNAVVTAAINADAVTGAKIADDAIGPEHIETLNGDVKFGDSGKAFFGAGDDLEIKHAGDHNYIWGNGANSGLTIGTNSTSALSIDTSQNVTINAGDLDLVDSKKIKLGAGDDLQIFHDGSNSYIDNSTGELQLRAAYLKIRAKDDGETIATFDDDAGIALYYDGSKKLETTSSGVTIPTSSSAHGLRISSTGDTYNQIRFDANRSNANTHIGRIINYWNGTAVSYISMDTGSDTTNKDDGIIRFWTSSGGGNYERMRILNGGGITFNGDTAAANAIDDYEEGTWTPTITTASGTITVSSHHD